MFKVGTEGGEVGEGGIVGRDLASVGDPEGSVVGSGGDGRG